MPPSEESPDSIDETEPPCLSDSLLFRPLGKMILNCVFASILLTLEAVTLILIGLPNEASADIAIFFVIGLCLLFMQPPLLIATACFSGTFYFWIGLQDALGGTLKPRALLWFAAVVGALSPLLFLLLSIFAAFVLFFLQPLILVSPPILCLAAILTALVGGCLLCAGQRIMQQWLPRKEGRDWISGVLLRATVTTCLIYPLLFAVILLAMGASYRSEGSSFQNEIFYTCAICLAIAGHVLLLWGFTLLFARRATRRCAQTQPAQPVVAA